MGRTLAGVLIAGALAACQPADDPASVETDAADIETSGITEITVTAAFEDVDGGASAVAFIPDSNAPWTGLIVTAPRDGGLDLYNADGEIVSRSTGPRLSSLAVSPGFALRGEALPLILGLNAASGSVTGYVLLRSGPALIEAPLTEIAMSDGIANICLVREGVGFVEIAVLGRGSNGEVWRVSDTGGDLIDAVRQSSFNLPAPARSCAYLDGGLIVSGPTLSLTRLNSDGATEAQAAMNAIHLAPNTLSGRPVVLAATGQDETLRVFDARTLAEITTVQIVTGLSTPGVERPGALSISDSSYGGASYQSGLVAIIDETDGRVRVIARETFARAIALVD